MLDIIRKNVRHPWIQAMLGIVIFVFILFFGWSMSSQKASYLAKVNGEAVDYRAYQQTYESMMRLYQEALGAQATPERLRQLGVGRRALDQLIERMLLAQEAGRRDIKVTDEDVQAAVQALPVFQEGGRFSKNRYLKILEANRLTPLEYEQQKREEILLGKVEQSIRAEAKVADEDVRKEYEERNTKVDLELAAFDPAEIRKALVPSGADLQAFYEARKESFRTPETRSARYVLFSPEAYLAGVTVTEQEVAKAFAGQAGQFTEKESVRARHILVKLAPGAKPDEEARVRKKAEEIRKEALSGKDFGALAKKYSEDPGSKDKGGELGTFERGQMVPEFEAAAFSLKTGQVSDLVKTSYGFHIVQVEDHKQGGAKTLEQVRPAIEAELKRTKALRAAYDAADKELIALEDGKKTWAGEAGSLKVQTTAPVARGGVVPGIAKPGEFVNLLFTLDPQKPGNLLETDQGTYLVAVDKVFPPSIPPPDAVKGPVEAKYREEEGGKVADKKAADFLEAAKKSGWDAAVKAAGVKVESTGPFAKKGGIPPKVGSSPELRDAAFALTTVGALGAKPVKADGKVYVFRLASRTPADPAGFAAQKEKLRAELLPTKQSEHLQDALKKLRAAAKIKINEDLVM